MGFLISPLGPFSGSENRESGSSDDAGMERYRIEDDFPVRSVGPLPDKPLDFPDSAVAGEVVVRFGSRKEYLAYLKALGEAGFAPLGQIDRLLAVRIPEAALLRLNLGRFGARAEYAYRVVQPEPPERVAPGVIGRLQAYGVSAREIVGGLPHGDGDGVIVAILDSGIQAHPQFDELYIVHIDLVGGGVAGPGAEHGTSVASIISGREGIVPNAELFVVRVLDDAGRGNSFHIAEGIVQAVDLGVKIINLSLGLYADAPVVREAVRYAAERGVLMVAAAGNDGYDRMPYPAAYPEVLSVTALDASGRQAQFPNQSVAIDFAAPGVGVETADGKSGTTLFSGTSAAAPFVTGTLASLLSGPAAMDPAIAVDLLKRHLNDAGAPGPDPEYGAGVLDWQRLRERGQTGILDIALAGLHLDAGALPGTTMPVEVTVQNRGTKWLTEATLEVALDNGEPVSFVIGTLGPGQITSRKVYTQLPSADSEAGLRVAARVLPKDPNEDVRLENNIQAVQFRPK